jgi:hypothetical protein
MLASQQQKPRKLATQVIKLATQWYQASNAKLASKQRKVRKLAIKS